MFFKKKEDSWLEQPGFLFLEVDLPIDIAPRILGCVVSDLRNPTDYFCPKNNYDAFKELELEVVDTNCRSFMSRNNLTTLSGRLGAVFELGGTTQNDLEVAITSHILRTRTLMQHPDILEKLKREQGPEIVDLMNGNNGTGYMVVGFKSAVDANKSFTLGKQKAFKFKLDVPVAAAAAAASHGTVAIPSSLVDPSFTTTGQSGERVELRSTMEGERIFAVRYRILKLDKKREPTMGPPVRVPFPGGVMAGPHSKDVIDDRFSAMPRGGPSSAGFHAEQSDEAGGDEAVTVQMLEGDNEQGELEATSLPSDDWMY